MRGEDYMTVFGYMRINGEPVNIDGYEECELLFVDALKAEEYSQLDQLLRIIEKEDVIIVKNLSVFELELGKMRRLIEILQNEKIRLISIDDHIDTDKNCQFYENLLTIGQVNEKVRGIKAKRRIARSKAIGVQIGRPKIDMTLVEKIKYYVHNEKLSMRATAEICQVSLGTVHKYSKMKLIRG